MTAFTTDRPEVLRDELIRALREVSDEGLQAVASALTALEQTGGSHASGSGTVSPELVVSSDAQLARELAERRRRGDYVESADMWASVLKDFE